MIRLFIENKELDINDSLSHQITYAVDDLKNLDAKATSFSKTLIIPGTANNNKLFGNIFEFSNSNFSSQGLNVGYNYNASKSAKARLDVNGLTIIKGVLRLLEIVIDGESIEYEVAIFGELGGFVNALGTKKLEDLDFNIRYQHVYNTTNIENSWTLPKTFSVIYPSGTLTFLNKYLYMYGNEFTQLEAGDSIVITGTSGGTNNGTYIIDNVSYDTNELKTIVVITTTFPTGQNTSGTVAVTKKGYGYYYPLIDYGNQSTNKKDYQYKTFRPAFFVKEYINRIIKDAGYTWQSNFFNTDFFTRLIIPNNDAKFNKRTYTNLITATKSTSQTLSYSNPTAEATVALTWQSTSLFGFSLDGTSTIYTCTNASEKTIKLSGSFATTINSSNSFSNFQVNIIKNGVIIKIVYPPNILVGDAVFSFELYDNFNTNDTLQFKLYSSNGLIYTWTNSITVRSASLSAQYDPPSFIEYSLNDVLNVNDAIPKNILQKDFFTSIMKMFNLIVTEDKYVNKKLVIEPWVDFYNLDRTTYKDWTFKIDRGNAIKIKPMSEINARYYNFKFKSDSDYYNDLYKKKYNEGYGDNTFDNKLDFTKESSSTEVIFSATPLLGYSGETKVVAGIFKWDGVSKGVNEESVTSNIRIMQVKKITGVPSWIIKNDTTSLLTTTQYGYAGHFDNPDAPNADLNFGATNELYFTLVAGGLQNNMFNAYYSPYMAEITDKDSRLVTAKIKLLEKDIYNLDFGKFIFVDGVLYRLQRIIDYSAGDICTVELLRVIYTQY
jgi:hypothetical protein